MGTPGGELLAHVQSAFALFGGEPVVSLRFTTGARGINGGWKGGEQATRSQASGLKRSLAVSRLPVA